MDDRTVDAVVEAGKLALLFGRTERVTKHEDGRIETDTDHTVMLGLIACALASKYEPTLDLGKIAQYALVHDLVEAYAGDTDTFIVGHTTVHNEKEAREEAALARIEKEFADSLPWIPETIREYESLATPEARFIKTLDKSMPKITHLANEGLVLFAEDERWNRFSAFAEEQREKLEKGYAKDQSIARELLSRLVERVEAMIATKKPEASRAS